MGIFGSRVVNAENAIITSEVKGHKTHIQMVNQIATQLKKPFYVEFGLAPGAGKRLEAKLTFPAREAAPEVENAYLNGVANLLGLPKINNLKFVPEGRSFSLYLRENNGRGSVEEQLRTIAQVVAANNDIDSELASLRQTYNGNSAEIKTSHAKTIVEAGKLPPLTGSELSR